MLSKRFNVILFLVTAVLLSLCYGDTNVLTNPGFESGTSGWSARSCSISTVTSPVRSGTYSGRAYSRTETWNGIQQNMMDKMVIGATYTISGWVRISGTSSATVTVTIQKTDSSNNGEPTYTNVASVTANNSGWTELSGDYTLNVTGTLVELNVYFEGPASGIDIYVDDAVVYGPEPGGGGSEASGTVDINTRHQEIEGFGAAVAWYENWLWSHQNANELYDLLFDELGLDIYRVRNTYNQGTGGTEYMSNTEDIVAAAKLRNPNLKILISSWTPPASLKSNSSLSGGGDATLAKSGGAFRYTDFANWWADSITAWAGYGVNADYISIQNEPDYDASWDSCRFDPTESTNIAGYNLAFEAVHSEMYSRFGASMPKMLAPEATGFHGSSGYNLHSYLTAIINHSNVYGYCHHLYNINAGDNPDNYISSMNSFYSSWGSKPLFQTEYEKSTDVWPDAYNLALLLHNSLTVENVSGYIYWDLVWNNGGLVTLPSYGASTYTINSDFYGFKHYSAFISPGWQRVDVTDDSPDIRMSSYINPYENELTVIIINTNASNAIELDLSFPGFSITSGQVYRTTSSQNCANIGSFSNPITVPARSVTTLALSGNTGNVQILNCSSTSGGSVTTPGEGDFNYNENTYADIVASADQFYHFVEWTGTAVTAGKVTNPYSASTTVYMDGDYTVIANFAANPPDVTPPTPNPMTWASVPTATSSSKITMTATTATDSESPPVQYYFECTNDPSKSSSWQSSTTYIAEGLTPLTEYTFRVKARDSYLTPNETGWSGTASATTLEPPTNVEIIGDWATGTSHTKRSGYSRALVFIAHGESNTASTLTSVTYGGQAMTKIISVTTGTSGFRNQTEAFILDEAGIAAATSGTFNPTWSGSMSSTGYTSVFLSNVNQADIVGATASNSTTGSGATITTDAPLATNEGDMVIVGVTNGNVGSYTLNNSFIEGADHTFGGTTGGTAAGGYKNATGAAETPSATYIGTSNRQAIIGLVVQTGAIVDEPPANPTGLTATAGNNLVSLDWDDNTEPDLAGYDVYRSEIQGSGYSKINASVVIDSDYIDYTAENWNTYYYVVKAVDIGSNESGYSNEASATPDFQNCDDVIAGGYGFVSDLTGNCYVDTEDLAIIVQYWLETDCASYNDCDGADLWPVGEPDGKVDFFDFSDFALDWLNCNDPTDGGCTPNWP